MSAADKYTYLSDIEHARARSGVYIGSNQLLTEDMFIADETNQIIKKKIEYISGLERLYEEAILNAFDQTEREGTGCTEIHVNIDKEKNTITIQNNGEGIPIVMKKELGIYVPEMIFGMLRTSSNYDDSEEKTVSGMNGMGIKLTNIFSTWFRLETADSATKKIYVQEWHDGMAKRSDPVITSLGRKKPYTKITYKPDFKYFKIDGLTDDMINLMKKRLIDIGFVTNSKIKTFYNDQAITIKKPDDYMKLYCDLNDGLPDFIIDDANERWIVGVMLSTTGFRHAAFVNGIHTSLGGSHVDYIMDVISKEVIDKLKSKKIEVKPSDVKNKLFVFIKASIINPVFDGQTKECLKMSRTKFGSKYEMSDKFKKKLLASDLLKQLMNVSDSKTQKDLSKTNGTKTSRLTGIKTLEDANWAGTTKSNQTRLILTEGLSAKTFAMSAITVIGRDRFGIFPLKGKPLNVRGTALSKVSNNDEIGNVVKILGLKYNTKYTDVSSLRYGGIVALADADNDGIHITSLILNIFHYFWPELLQMGYVSFCSTPIVKVYKAKETLSFYTINDFETWVEQNETKTFKAKYFKGLGTSTSAEARDALQDIDNKLIAFNSDEHVDKSVNLAFDKKQTNERKAWLMDRYDPKDNINRTLREVDVSDYINKELIHFSYYDNQRSIPNIMDGLKPSQRKILYTAIKYLGTNEMKVAQFAAKVAEKTDYHHGEASIMGAVVNMAQTYVGSNNMHMLDPIGAFGSRLSSGSDAASPRYIFTKLTPIAKRVFDDRDSQLLNYLDSDGMKIEPEWFVPVIPTILVNGSLGIGSGFSTEILKYNPIDLCKYLLVILDGKKPAKNLKPWYRGFKGTVERLDTGKYRTIGCYSFDDEMRTLHITELPIGVSTDDYKEFIEGMLEESKVKDKKDSKTKDDKKEKKVKDNTVTDIRYGNSDVIVSIEIVLHPSKYGAIKAMDKDDLLTKFKLSSKLSCTNMYLFNHHGIINKYNNVYEIIKEFHSVRSEFYIKRRDAIIALLEYELMIISNKVRFILAVKEGKIELRKTSDESLLKYLVNNNFDVDSKSKNTKEEVSLKDYSYLIDMPIRSITAENAKKLKQQEESKQQELEEVLATSATQMWKNDIQSIIEENERSNQLLEEANSSTSKIKPSSSKKPAKRSKK